MTRVTILAAVISTTAVANDAGFGFEAGQLEINVQQAAARLGGQFSMISESPFENAQGWTMRRSMRLPSATWIMASETSRRCS